MGRVFFFLLFISFGDRSDPYSGFHDNIWLPKIYNGENTVNMIGHSFFYWICFIFVGNSSELPLSVRQNPHRVPIMA